MGLKQIDLEEATSRFGHISKTKIGVIMKVDLKGLMNNICEILEDQEVTDKYNHSAAYAHLLQEMVENLAELRDRKAEGEKVIDEFFNLYVFFE